jgi:NADH dehydrogenase [ubiquinone] 1 alpha subcomplex assembly factor 5
MRLSLRRVSALPALRSRLCLPQPCRRQYAFQAAGAPVFDVFNRKTKWMQRERAAANVEASRRTDYLRDEVAGRLCERLLVGCTCWTESHVGNAEPPFLGYQTGLSQGP